MKTARAVAQKSAKRPAKAAPPEIRLNADGTLDEVVAAKAAFHLEQLDAGQWWMSVTCGGKDIHVTLYTKRNAPILANVIDSDA